jgi:hypothetical protein
MAKSKKAAKSKKKAAAVTLDAGTASKIEATLREALVNASAANIVTVPKPPKTHTKAAVPLDAATVARFTEHLRQGLQSAAAANIADHAAADAATKKIG